LGEFRRRNEAIAIRFHSHGVIISHQARTGVDLEEAKRKGQKIISTPEQPRQDGNVVNLMDALRKSIEGKPKEKVKGKAKKSA
jgi:non-homologous end joining protein Ku